MDNVVANTKNSWYKVILDIPLAFISVFLYAFIGIKTCTIDLARYIIRKIKSSFSGEVIKSDEMSVSLGEYHENMKKKKQKVYKYSVRTMQKLEEEAKKLAVDLQSSGATRSKEVNVYLYKVRDKNGKIIKGTMNGVSKLDVNSFLVNEGYTVYSIETSDLINFLYKESSFGLGSPKLKTKELIFLLTQLSTYLKSGITLNDSVKILERQMAKKKSRARSFQSISYELMLGSSFSQALEKQGSMFPALLINMIKAAEASGTLIETLDDMADYYTEVDDTRKQMKSAMTYPIIVSFFALGVIIFILLYIIPQFVAIYETNDVPLNGLTQFIINFSNFLKGNILLIIGLVILGIITLIIAYKRIKAFRKAFQTLLMHIPVVKDIIIYNELTIFTKTFASLLRNNVFITESITILSKITNNEIYKEILYRTINNIVKGEKISEAFKDHWAVPDVAYYMIVTGESTGELAEMLQKVSVYYQGLHRSVVNNLKAFIEPVLIAFLAFVVGGIIISVIVPMFGMYEQVFE